MLTHSTTTITATAVAHGFTNNQWVTIAGADPAQYNGDFIVTVVYLDTFTYTLAGDPGADATGTAMSATGFIMATATLNSHGYVANQLVTIAGADQGAYNGTFPVYSATTNTFLYALASDPAQAPVPRCRRY